MDEVLNPVISQSNSGKFNEPAWNNFNGVLNSHIVEIDSRVRDFNLYPNANNFAIQFPQRYKKVVAIELLNAIIPIRPINIGPADEKFVSLRIKNGSNDLVGSSGVDGVGSGNYMPIFDCSFHSIPLINNFGIADTTFWKREERRAIVRPKAPLASLDRLVIQLEQVSSGGPFGAVIPYPLTPVTSPTNTPLSENEIKLTFEIVCSN